MTDEDGDAARPAKNRTPDGMTRHTLYIPTAAAAALDDTAEQLHEELGGVVPKHRILAELITAAVAAAPTVRAELRRALLTQLIRE